MLYLLSGIAGSVLSIAFFLGGLKATRNYDNIVRKIEDVIEKATEPAQQTTFSEPITPMESFNNAKIVDDLLQK